MARSYEDYSVLTFDRPTAGVVRITIDQPETLNSLGHVGHHELVDVWATVDADDAAQAIVIRGAGRAFSAGGDFEMLEDIHREFAAKVSALRGFRDLVYNIINCSKPIVSAIHGPCVGAGLATALMADISIAAKSARLIDGHTRLGVAAGDHAAMIWPILCGMAKAKYHILLCEAVTGAEAEEMGLVSLSVEDDELDARSIEIAERLAQGPTTALRWTKYAMNNWFRMLGPVFDNSTALEVLSFGSPEFVEGLASLREKRDPDFTSLRTP